VGDLRHDWAEFAFPAKIVNKVWFSRAIFPLNLNLDLRHGLLHFKGRHDLQRVFPFHMYRRQELALYK
jgi:hypothetical protein